MADCWSRGFGSFSGSFTFPQALAIFRLHVGPVADQQLALEFNLLVRRFPVNCFRGAGVHAESAEDTLGHIHLEVQDVEPAFLAVREFTQVLFG